VDDSVVVKVLEPKSHIMTLSLGNLAKNKEEKFMGQKYQLLPQCRGVILEVNSNVAECEKRGEQNGKRRADLIDPQKREYISMPKLSPNAFLTGELLLMSPRSQMVGYRSN
jgi:hypothetical protein